MASGRDRGYSDEAHFDRFGRNSENCVSRPNFRSWLFASFRKPMGNVGYFQEPTS